MKDAIVNAQILSQITNLVVCVLSLKVVQRDGWVKMTSVIKVTLLLD